MGGANSHGDRLMRRAKKHGLGDTKSPDKTGQDGEKSP